MELYFGFNAENFPTDKHKVLFASTYLRGPAFEWFNSFLTDFLNNKPDKRNDDTVEVTQIYSNFKNKLRQVFGDFDKEHLAERRMQSRRQTGSAANYASKFQQLAAQTQWGAVPLVAQFYQRLKDRVEDNVAQVNRPSQLQSMITLAIWINDRQYERELEKKGTYNFSKKDRYQKSPKKDQYGMVPMELDATEKRNQSPRKETHKCYNCGKIGHLAKACKCKKQVNATQSKKKEKKRREPKEDKQLNATQTKAKPDHATLSWTGCYDDDSYIHLSDKQKLGWFSKQHEGKQLNATGQQEDYNYNRLIKKPFLGRINKLQEEIDKLQEECQEPLQDSATVKWETESLILSFREETLNIKKLIPHYLEIQQKDSTLCKRGEKRVS